MDYKLVFNTRKMSVSMVKAALAKHPDLSIDQLKALLAHEGNHWRPRRGIEHLLDARLTALAEAALELVAEEMEEVELPAEAAPEEFEDKQEPEEVAAPAIAAVEPGFVLVVEEEWPEIKRDDESPDAEANPPFAIDTPVHVMMLNGEVHEGHYVKPVAGSMIRMRDGQDTIVFAPDDKIWVSPSEDNGEEAT